MAVDLLDRLKQESAIDSGEDSTEVTTGDFSSSERVVIEIDNNNDELDDYKRKVDKVQSNIRQIQQCTEQSKDIYSCLFATVDTNEYFADLEKCTATVKRLGGAVTALLKDLQKESERAQARNPTSAVSRMKVIQYQACRRMFVNAMDAHSTAQSEYKEKCKKQIRRQFGITGVDKTDEELEEILAGNFDVFTQNIIAHTAKEKQALADVTARHKDLQKLEQSIVELRDIFLETAVLIENQGGLVDRIEYNVANAAEFVAQAKTETKIAHTYQKAAAKKKFWLFLIIVIVLLIIIIWVSV